VFYHRFWLLHFNSTILVVINLIVQVVVKPVKLVIVVTVAIVAVASTSLLEFIIKAVVVIEHVLVEHSIHQP
jgi:hypothetical protein